MNTATPSETRFTANDPDVRPFAVAKTMDASDLGIELSAETSVPKPNEPRGDLLPPTVAFHHAVAQALWAGKLFHIDLSAQRIGRYDQDFRFGSEGIKDAFCPDGVWDFARGCIRTYRLLAEAAARFDADPEVHEALAAAKVDQLATPTALGATAERVRAYARTLDETALASTHDAHERFDQLAVDHILGAR